MEGLSVPSFSRRSLSALRKSLRFAAPLALSASLLVSAGFVHADVLPDDPAGADADLVELAIPELPQALTDDQMASIADDGFDGVIELDMSLDELSAELDGAEIDLDLSDPEASAADALSYSQFRTAAFKSSNVRTALAGNSCRLVPGNMWTRASGYGYPYGAIGSKPQLNYCSAGVRKTGIHSDVYRWNGWWWEKVAGTFNSYGTGNMQQKSVEYRCKGTASNLYQVITTAWGTTSTGQTGVGRDATSSWRFFCS